MNIHLLSENKVRDQQYFTDSMRGVTVIRNGVLVRRVTKSFFVDKIKEYLNDIGLTDYIDITGSRTYTKRRELEAGAARYTFVVNRGGVKSWIKFFVYQSFYEFQDELANGKSIHITNKNGEFEIRIH